MTRSRSGAVRRQPYTRQSISAAAEYDKYTRIAGVLLGLFFGLAFFFGW